MSKLAWALVLLTSTGLAAQESPKVQGPIVIINNSDFALCKTRLAINYQRKLKLLDRELWEIYLEDVVANGCMRLKDDGDYIKDVYVKYLGGETVQMLDAEGTAHFYADIGLIMDSAKKLPALVERLKKDKKEGGL